MFLQKALVRGFSCCWFLKMFLVCFKGPSSVVGVGVVGVEACCRIMGLYFLFEGIVGGQEKKREGKLDC